jgi:tetratricopeptide (TPR) repeat protein
MFETVIQVADQDPKASKPAALKQEALNDLVRVLAQSESHQQAAAAIKKIAPEAQWRSLLGRLAAAYSDQGKMADALEVLRSLVVSSQKCDLKTIRFQGLVLETLADLFQQQELLDEAHRQIALIRAQEKCPVSTERGGLDLAGIKSEAREELITLANRLCRNAVASKAKESCAQARSLGALAAQANPPSPGVECPCQP